MSFVTFSPSRVKEPEEQNPVACSVYDGGGSRGDGEVVDGPASVWVDEDDWISCRDRKASFTNLNADEDILPRTSTSYAIVKRREVEVKHVRKRHQCGYSLKGGIGGKTLSLMPQATCRTLYSELLQYRLFLSVWTCSSYRVTLEALSYVPQAKSRAWLSQSKSPRNSNSRGTTANEVDGTALYLLEWSVVVADRGIALYGLRSGNCTYCIHKLHKVQYTLHSEPSNTCNKYHAILENIYKHFTQAMILIPLWKCLIPSTKVFQYDTTLEKATMSTSDEM